MDPRCKRADVLFVEYKLLGGTDDRRQFNRNVIRDGQHQWSMTTYQWMRRCIEHEQRMAKLTARTNT